MNTVSVDPDLYILGIFALFVVSVVIGLWSRYRFRFSVRTLLIFTTVLALLLGAGIWLRS